ncbi:unnamed protein product [Aphis gossypii]|uniref:Uncharacterized protein n=1 Tax=Aphis gossypii TaxID=80765 RepID=A0A9P0J5S9_APHGO|nr:unnamed protein product [Aphis gossypii]
MTRKQKEKLNCSRQTKRTTRKQKKKLNLS